MTAAIWVIVALWSARAEENGVFFYHRGTKRSNAQILWNRLQQWQPDEDPAGGRRREVRLQPRSRTHASSRCDKVTTCTHQSSLNLARRLPRAICIWYPSAPSRTESWHTVGPGYCHGVVGRWLMGWMLWKGRWTRSLVFPSEHLSAGEFDQNNNKKNKPINQQRMDEGPAWNSGFLDRSAAPHHPRARHGSNRRNGAKHSYKLQLMPVWNTTRRIHAAPPHPSVLFSSKRARAGTDQEMRAIGAEFGLCSAAELRLAKASSISSL